MINKYVCLTFDDTKETHYTTAFPALAGRGVTGTLFAMPDYLDTGTYMTTAQLLEMAAAGWEVSGHGDTDIRDQSYSEIEALFASVQAWAAGLGLPVLPGWCYVGGYYSADGIEIAKRYFTYARAALDTLSIYSRYPVDKLLIPSAYQDDSDTLDKLLRGVKQNIPTEPGGLHYMKYAMGQFYVCHFHGVGGKQALLESFIDQILADGFTIINLGDAIRLGLHKDRVLLDGQNIVRNPTFAGSDIYWAESVTTMTLTQADNILTVYTTASSKFAYQRVRVIPGMTYNYTIDMKSVEAGGAGRLYIKEITDGKNSAFADDTEILKVSNTTTDWVTSSGTLTMPSGCHYIELQLYQSGAGKSSQFRNFTITPTVTGR
jgi:peptidoglycan/xylan/chitin deacetylase (PgdA/CDA1 family)